MKVDRIGWIWILIEGGVRNMHLFLCTVEGMLNCNFNCTTAPLQCNLLNFMKKVSFRIN